jgi:hypothetical protein
MKALELRAALVAAATLGILAWALRHLLPAMPKWSIPFAAAVGLIGYNRGRVASRRTGRPTATSRLQGGLNGP